MLSRQVQGFGEYQIPALNSMTSPEQKLDFLNQQIQAISVAATQAQARGDAADLQSLITLLRQAASDAAQLRGEVNAAEAPSSFMLALDQFSDSAISVASKLGNAAVNAVTDTLGAASTTAKTIPLLLVGIVVVLGIGLYKGSLSARISR